MEIARYEQRSSKTLHAIATQALRKLGLGTLSDFRLLYTGCGDSRVKRNIRLHARYVGQHSAHRLTQYVQNMVSGILYPEKVIVGKSINSDAPYPEKCFPGKENICLKKDQECYDTAALLLPPTAARTDSLQCRGQNISTALGCRSGRHAVQPVQRAGVLTSVREGCVSFFSVPQELYLHSLKRSTGSVCNITCIRTEEELRNKLRHRPQSVVISAGRPAECAEMWFRFYRDQPIAVVLCVAPFFCHRMWYFWRSQKPEVTETGMSVERAISVANASGGFSGLKHAENLPVMDSYSVFMNEVNNRTKTIVMSERFPEKQRKVLSLLLAGHSWEYSAQFLKTGIRQIWLAEQSLKSVGQDPADSMSLREALLLSSNKFHGDGNALEKTNAMTLRENGNTNRYSVVVNAGTQALSLHKYK